MLIGDVILWIKLPINRSYDWLVHSSHHAVGSMLVWIWNPPQMIRHFRFMWLWVRSSHMYSSTVPDMKPWILKYTLNGLYPGENVWQLFRDEAGSIMSASYRNTSLDKVYFKSWELRHFAGRLLFWISSVVGTYQMSTQNRPTRPVRSDRVPGFEAWYKGFNWDKFQDFTLDPWYLCVCVFCGCVEGKTI